MTFGFPKVQRLLASVSRRQTLCCCGAAALVLLVRAALLPIWQPPVPSIYDEFSYLLQADTFAHGRVTNSSHSLWQFFESIYILQKPTYASKYPPGQSLAMAIGERVLGHPWFGVWLSCGAMAAALCWALQGFLPPAWALLGSAISLQLCFFSYWMNSYWGGAVAATGGALVVGAYARIAGRRSPGSAFYACILGLGVVVLMYTRPFEGLLLAVPVLAVLLRADRTPQVWMPIVLIGAAGAGWLGYYNYRVTGNALLMPYQEYFNQYETTPPFNVMSLAPANSRTFRHFDFEFLDKGWALETWNTAHSWRFPIKRARDLYQAMKMILGSPLWIAPLLIFAPRLLRSRRTRLPAWLAVAWVTGALITVPYYPHYAAPFAAVLLILAVEALRSVRQVVPLLAGIIFAYMLWTDASQIYRHRTPDAYRAVNGRKGDIERRLAAQSPGQHVIIVHYTGSHSPHEEWIYNPADIDAAPVIWAQDMGDTENRRLIRYYPGRAFWKFEPDESPDNLIPYAASGGN